MAAAPTSSCTSRRSRATATSRSTRTSAWSSTSPRASVARRLSRSAPSDPRLTTKAPDVRDATDEEGGDVTRLYTAVGSPVPGNAALGAVDDPALTRRVAASIGAALAAAGIDLDLAPVVDVNSDPRNPVIGVRSFGADPALVARHTTAYVEGLQSAGVGACA